MNRILLGSLAAIATLAITAGTASADDGGTTTVPGQVVQQTPTQTAPAPSQDVINIANYNATIITAGDLASNEHVDPNLHPASPTTCYSVWETTYQVEQFGARIESACFTLVIVPPQSDPTQRSVKIMYNNVETFADGSKYVWGYTIYSYDSVETSAHTIPPSTYDVNNMLTVN